MKQRELEIVLQKLEGFSSPSAILEQYPTPAKIAADILYIAHGFADIEGRRVIDLGCGTGIFAIGACLLGAAKAVGLDVDPEALKTARLNTEKIGCAVEFTCDSVEKVSGSFDTCIMNPPFGSQNRHADIPFLDKAMEIASTVYSLHNSETIDFLRRKVEKTGWRLELEKNYKFEIRHTFSFHRKEKALFDVTLIRIVKP
jgi:putative methylase